MRMQRPLPSQDGCGTGIEFLRQTYGDEISIDSNGQIRAASVRALIGILTAPNHSPDPLFVSTFYTTFRLFITPEQLILRLEERFDLFMLTGSVEGCAKVVEVLTQMISLHWGFDSDIEAMLKIKGFNRDKVYPSFPGPASEIAAAIARLSAATSSATKSDPLPLYAPYAQRIWSQKERSLFDLLQSEPLELARQLTIRSAALFGAIRPEELLPLQGRRDPSKAPNVLAMALLFDDVFKLVSEVVLRIQTSTSRARSIAYWINVARCLHELANFDIMLSIVNALSSSSITQLQLSWVPVSEKDRRYLQKLQEIVTPKKGFLALRHALQSAELPSIPVIALYLTDLTFVQEAHPDMKPGTDLINFGKHVKTTKAITALLRVQVPYKLESDLNIQKCLDACFLDIRSETHQNYAETPNHEEEIASMCLSSFSPPPPYSRRSLFDTGLKAFCFKLR